MSSITISGLGTAHRRNSSGAEAVRTMRNPFGLVARRPEKGERDMSFLDFIDMFSENVHGIAISCLTDKASWAGMKQTKGRLIGYAPFHGRTGNGSARDRTSLGRL